MEFRADSKDHSFCGCFNQDQPYIYCRTPCGDQPPPPRSAAWLCDSVSNCCRHSVEWVIVFRCFLDCSGIWGRLVSATRTVVRRPVGRWFLRPNGANMGAKWVPNGSLEASWSLLASSRPPGAVLEASWGGLGGLLGTLGAVLEASWTLLGVSWALLRRSWRHLERQKAPKTEPGGVPNRFPEASRAENDETLIFDDSTQDFNGF